MTENIDKIVRKTCSVFNITKEELRSKNQDRHLVYARMICVKHIKSLCNLSSSKIAEAINRDSSTVRYYLSVVEKECFYNSSFRTLSDEVGLVCLEIRSDLEIELEQELNEIIG